MNKKKSAEERVVELTRETDSLKLRVRELEQQLDSYKAHEKDIMEAMTLAASAKAKIIAEAESIASSMTGNADKVAAGTVAEAEGKAQSIVEEAQAKAEQIIAEAKAQAQEMLRQTQTKTTELLGIAHRESKELTAHTETVNNALIGTAIAIFDYISTYKDKYEQVTGKPFGAVPEIGKTPETEETDKMPQVDLSGTCETPEELYYRIRGIWGAMPATPAVSTETPVTPADDTAQAETPATDTAQAETPADDTEKEEKSPDGMEMPEAVDLTPEMLGLGDPMKAIRAAINAAQSGTAQMTETAAPATPAPEVTGVHEPEQTETQPETDPVTEKEDETEEETEQETEPAESASVSGTDVKEAPADDVETMMKDYMDLLGTDTAETSLMTDDSDDDSDGSSVMLPALDAEELKRLLSQVITDTDGE